MGFVAGIDVKQIAPLGKWVRRPVSNCGHSWWIQIFLFLTPIKVAHPCSKRALKELSLSTFASSGHFSYSFILLFISMNFMKLIPPTFFLYSSPTCSLEKYLYSEVASPIFYHREGARYGDMAENPYFSDSRLIRPVCMDPNRLPDHFSEWPLSLDL